MRLHCVRGFVVRVPVLASHGVVPDVEFRDRPAMCDCLLSNMPVKRIMRTQESEATSVSPQLYCPSMFVSVTSSVPGVLSAAILNAKFQLVVSPADVL